MPQCSENIRRERKITLQFPQKISLVSEVFLTDIVIGETSVIGNRVRIYQGVTLGTLSTRGGQSLKGKKRHPTVEDYVTIYFGASILCGDTVIGKTTVIGSNVFITKSVPDNTKLSIKIP